MFKNKNRWFIAASAVGVHASIGSVYAYSAWLMPLESAFGWSPKNTTFAFSLAIFFLGASAAFLGRFIERHGASKGGLLSAAFFCTGLIGSGVACWMHNLWLFYFFFGIVSGIGLGLGYISPVSTLVKWFPDRRGLATGLAIMGFGFGGLICENLVSRLVPAADEVVLPKTVETYDYVTLRANDPAAADALLASTPELETFKAGVDQEYALFVENKTDSAEYRILKAQKDTYRNVLIYEKKYVIRAFIALGIIYFCIMIPSALYISPPPAGYADQFAAKVADPKNAKRNPLGEMTAMQSLRTPAFYGLWLMLFLNVSCGIAVIATAKKMGYEMVRLPVEMASILVMGISLFNGLGRILWATFSDYIGRSNTYVCFFAIQIVAFPALAHLTHAPIAFMAVTFLILTCYGGGFASIPAYISDLFGVKEMPTIHGFILTAWSLAGIVGPMLNAYVYEKTNSYEQSLYVFGGAFVVALIIALLMKLETRRLRSHYQSD